MNSNPYQKHSVSLNEVIKNIHVGPSHQVSRLILAVAPCRSGTTVFLRVFGAANIQSHFQPLKNILRWHLQTDAKNLPQMHAAHWHVPQDPDKTVFLKETLGPYVQAESLFNPLDVLLKAGVPSNKLHLIIMGRAPLSTWVSWDQWWRGKTSVENFVMAYEKTERIRQQALAHNIPTTVWVYEALKTYTASTLIPILFKRLEIPYTDKAIQKWDTLPPFGAPESNIVFPKEPPIFVVPHIHDSAETSKALTFHYAGDIFSKAGQLKTSALAPATIAKLADSPLASLYKDWCTACGHDFQITITPDDDWYTIIAGATS